MLFGGGAVGLNPLGSAVQALWRAVAANRTARSSQWCLAGCAWGRSHHLCRYSSQSRSSGISNGRPPAETAWPKHRCLGPFQKVGGGIVPRPGPLDARPNDAPALVGHDAGDAPQPAAEGSNVKVLDRLLVPGTFAMPVHQFSADVFPKVFSLADTH